MNHNLKVIEKVLHEQTRTVSTHADSLAEAVGNVLYRDNFDHLGDHCINIDSAEVISRIVLDGNDAEIESVTYSHHPVSNQENEWAKAIKNVNWELLEKQRATLNKVLFMKSESLPKEWEADLMGIQGLLDAISDIKKDVR